MPWPHDLQVLVSYLPLTGVGREEYGYLHSWLTPAEQIRAAQYGLPQDRLAFAAGRALARALLSRLAPTPLHGWIFVLDPHGKPQVEPGASSGLEFSISHTTQMVAVAAAVRRSVGIDIESTSADVSFLDIASSRFAPTEQTLLASLSEDSQRHGFFSLWTLHEAYAKARGEGISDNFSEVAFTLDPPSMAFAHGSSEEPVKWAFRLLDLPAAHLLAVTAAKQPSEELAFSIAPTDIATLLKRS